MHKEVIALHEGGAAVCYLGPPDVPIERSSTENLFRELEATACWRDPGFASSSGPPSVIGRRPWLSVACLAGGDAADSDVESSLRKLASPTFSNVEKAIWIYNCNGTDLSGLADIRKIRLLSIRSDNITDEAIVRTLRAKSSDDVSYLRIIGVQLTGRIVEQVQRHHQFRVVELQLGSLHGASSDARRE